MEKCRPGRPMEKGKPLPNEIELTADNVHEIIKQLRLNKKLSLRAFGDMLGVSDAAISSWEHQTALPKLLDFLDIVDALGYDVSLKKRG